jgi:hypothetical protein
MLIAPKGHFLGQIPHPIHRLSEMKAIFDSGVTSMQRRPLRTTGHDFLHSCLHFCEICQDMLYFSWLDRIIPWACTEYTDDVSMPPVSGGVVG